jgi:hypothetical protein
VVDTKTKKAAPVGEKGFVNGFSGWETGYGLFDPFEDNPELMWPNSVRTYQKMGRSDARVSSVLRAVGLPIRRTPWRIDPNGARDEVVELVARDLGLPIVGADDNDAPKPPLRDRFSWQAHLQQALLHLKFGHSVFERWYRIDGAGVAHIARVAPRPAATIGYWNVARNGDLVSIMQWAAGTFISGGFSVIGGDASSNTITADRLVVYQNEPDAGVPYGNSVLRPAWKHWKLKDEHMRIQAAADRRLGIGVPGFTASEDESENQDRLNEYQAMASGYRGGETSGFSIPNGASFKIYGVEGNPPDLQAPIDYHDRQIGLVVLAHFLNLDGKGGSYALASVQADTFTQSVQTVAGDMRDTAQATLVEDLVMVNYGPDEPVPMLTFDEIGSQQDATAAALNLLALAGLITPDPRLEAAIRQASGLPAPDPDTEPANDPEEVAERVKVAAAARLRARGRSTKDRRKEPDGAQTLW